MRGASVLLLVLVLGLAALPEGDRVSANVIRSARSHLIVRKRAVVPRASTVASVHVIVFDAGSTGTRLNYFGFSKREDGQFPYIKLDSYKTLKTAPGLSAYASQVRNAFESVDRLIQELNIPRDGAELLVKATAGLRLLEQKNQKIADAVMDAVYEGLHKKYGTGFEIKRENVGVLPGVREGDYAYLAMVYLNALSENKENKLFGMMDLGGASTQITFDLETFDPEKTSLPFTKSPMSYFSTLSALGRNYRLYSHSYLGQGMTAQRFLALGVSDRCKQTDCSTDTRVDVYRSPCFHADLKTNLNIGAGMVLMGGKAGVESSQRYQLCRDSLQASVVSVLPVGDNRTLFYDAAERGRLLLQSGFYYILYGMGLIKNNGDRVTLGEIEKGARVACEKVKPNGNRFEPYRCMDLTFVVALLHDGYGFSYEEEFCSALKLSGWEAGWALGLGLKEGYDYLFQSPAT